MTKGVAEALRRLLKGHTLTAAEYAARATLEKGLGDAVAALMPQDMGPVLSAIDDGREAYAAYADLTEGACPSWDDLDEAERDEWSGLGPPLLLDGSRWCPLADAEGEWLWAQIVKGKAHKYVKRVPTGNPKRPWRYYYKQALGASSVHHAAHMTVGASFADGAIGAHGGHWHIVARDGDQVTVRHDETKEERQMSLDDLQALLLEAHAHELEALTSARRAKRQQEIVEAAEHGTAKQVAAAKRRAEKTEQEIVARERAARKSAQERAKRLLAERMSARGLELVTAKNVDGHMVTYWVRPDVADLVRERGTWSRASGSESKDPFKRWAMRRFDGLPYPYDVPIAAATPGDAFDYAANGIKTSLRAWQLGPDGRWGLVPSDPTLRTSPPWCDVTRARMGERTKTGEVYAGRLGLASGPTWAQVHDNGWIMVPSGIDPNTETRSHAEIIEGLELDEKSRIEAMKARAAQEAQARELERQRRQEAAWDTYTTPEGAPVPDNAVHPRIIPELEDRRYQAWVWDARRQIYRKSERFPDTGRWLQGYYGDDLAGWQKVLQAVPGAIFVPAGEVPIYARPEPPANTVQLGVSVERPPDFLALNMGHIETRETHDGRFTNHVPTGTEDWLKEHGFWQALDRDHGHEGFLARVLIDKAKRGESYGSIRSDKVKSLISEAARNLAAWWSDINDEEREYFWSHFCDQSRQPRVERPHDPRHHDADFDVPPGMEKFAAKGWSFHEYQRKAINFAIKHAMRVLWAEEMGLGKTLQAIGLYHALKAKGQVKQMLITAPSSAIGSWEDEFSGNSDARVRILAEATVKERDEAYEAFRRGEIDALVMTPYVLGLPAIGDDVPVTKATIGKAPVGTVLVTRNSTDANKRTFWTKRGNVWVTTDWSHDGKESTVSDAEILKRKPKVQIDRDDHWATEDLDANKLHRIISERPHEILRITDEVHLFKNADAARRRGFEKAICRPEGRVVGMSGTPKPNGPEDFFTVVNDITRGALGDSLDEFARRYCYVTEGKFGGIVGFRPDALSELYADNAGFLFARTTADPDSKVHLPPQLHLSPRLKPDEVQAGIQQELVRAMTLLHKALRDEAYMRSQGMDGSSPARDKLYRMASGEDGPLAQLAANKTPWDERSLLIRLKQASIDPSILDDEEQSVTGPNGPLASYESPKMKAVVDAATTHLSQNPDTGCVLFSTSVGGLYAMRSALVRRGLREEDIGIIHGGVKLKDREKIRRDLNEGKIKVVIGQTKALNTGANMQARANFVAHIDTPWEPDVLTQATARVHRQGQKRKVTVFRPVGSDVDALIERRVASKLRANANALGSFMESDRVALESMVGRGLSDDAFTDELAKTLGVSVDVLKPSGERILSGMRDILGEDGADAAEDR